MGLFDKLFNKGNQGADFSIVVNPDNSHSVSYRNDGIAAPVDEKLRNILIYEFFRYQFVENAPLTSFGGPAEGMPYSFAVLDGRVPKLLIMIIGRNTCSQKDYKISKEFASSYGIPMINFIEHFDNKVSYIRDRLHNYI